MKAQELYCRLSRVEVMVLSIQLVDDSFVIYLQLAESLRRAFPRLNKDPAVRLLFMVKSSSLMVEISGFLINRVNSCVSLSWLSL